MIKATPHFKEREWACKCAKCNQQAPHRMDPEVMQAVEEIRIAAGRSLVLTSAYRCPNHPEEAKKTKPGQHSNGVAVDIQVADGAQRYQIIQLGLALGATGIGVANTFVHLDWRKSTPVVWKY